MSAILGPILGAVAGPLLGGLLGKSADKQAAQPTTQTVNQEPWAGIQPYLTGTSNMPAFLSGTPDLTMPWLQWAQGVGEGSLAAPPPPMLADSIRAQQGIGMPGGRPVTNGQRIGSGPAQPKENKPQKQPSPPAINPWVEAFNAGYAGDVKWLNKNNATHLTPWNDLAAAANLGKQQRLQMSEERARGSGTVGGKDGGG